MNRKVIAIGVGTLFSYSISMASNIVFKLANSDLKIKGELSFNESKPVIISGFDNSNKPFKLTIEMKPQAQNILQISYSLDRAGKIQSGSVNQEKGKTAQLYIGPQDKKELGLSFEATVSE